LLGVGEIKTKLIRGESPERFNSIDQAQRLCYVSGLLATNGVNEQLERLLLTMISGGGASPEGYPERTIIDSPFPFLAKATRHEIQYQVSDSCGKLLSYPYA